MHIISWQMAKARSKRDRETICLAQGHVSKITSMVVQFAEADLVHPFSQFKSYKNLLPQK